MVCVGCEGGRHGAAHGGQLADMRATPHHGHLQAPRSQGVEETRTRA
jgi:hypothetical protein